MALESVAAAIAVGGIYDRVENEDVAEWLARVAAQAQSQPARQEAARPTGLE